MILFLYSLGCTEPHKYIKSDKMIHGYKIKKDKAELIFGLINKKIEYWGILKEDEIFHKSEHEVNGLLYMMYKFSDKIITTEEIKKIYPKEYKNGWKKAIQDSYDKPFDWINDI